MEEKIVKLENINIHFNVFEGLIINILKKYSKFKLVTKNNLIVKDKNNIRVSLHLKILNKKESIESNIDSLEREIFEKIFFFYSMKPSGIIIRVS